MRKRTRKHRGTAGKMVGGFLAFFCLILLTAGMFWAIQGYVSYQKAVKEKPLAQAVEEARSGAQWASLEQVPDLYKKAVLAVEDHRYYTHHGIDWISMARAVVHDIRVMKPEQGGSTITQQLVKTCITIRIRHLPGKRQRRGRHSMWNGSSRKKKFWNCTSIPSISGMATMD